MMSIQSKDIADEVYALAKVIAEALYQKHGEFADFDELKDDSDYTAVVEKAGKMLDEIVEEIYREMRGE